LTGQRVRLRSSARVKWGRRIDTRPLSVIKCIVELATEFKLDLFAEGKTSIECGQVPLVLPRSAVRVPAGASNVAQRGKREHARIKPLFSVLDTAREVRIGRDVDSLSIAAPDWIDTGRPTVPRTRFGRERSRPARTPPRSQYRQPGRASRPTFVPLRDDNILLFEPRETGDLNGNGVGTRRRDGQKRDVAGGGGFRGCYGNLQCPGWSGSNSPRRGGSAKGSQREIAEAETPDVLPLLLKRLQVR
jgi:hypothetical protein